MEGLPSPPQERGQLARAQEPLDPTLRKRQDLGKSFAAVWVAINVLRLFA
jgi:hypothetical protein